jgi:SPP1 gp7 family putative phage head morphogenesis protein
MLSYRDHIRQAARLAKARRRGRPLPRPNKPRPPTHLSRQYLAEIRPRLRFARALVQAALPIFKKALEDINAQRASARQDEGVGDVKRSLGNIKFAFMRRYSQAEAEELARRMAARGRTFSAEQVQNQFKKVIGIDVIAASPAIEPLVEAAIADNVALITSISEKYFGEIEQAVMQSLRTGANTRDLVDLLQERYDVSESRATLIAVDQTNKLNGQLQQANQEALGVTGYIWRSAQDERVRDSHRLLDGQRFSWADPPEVGHPGQDYRCRCQPEADIEALLSDDAD